MAAPSVHPSAHPSAAQVPMAIAITGIPPGLEYLAYLDTIYVHQEIELLELFTSMECNNRYSILNAQGQRIYFAAENTDACTRYCCENLRPFNINILDPAGATILTVNRPCTCGLYWCHDMCGNMVEVKAGVTGELLGTVEIVYKYCQPTFNLINDRGEIVFICQTAKCGMCCACGTVSFDLLTPDGTNVGSVTKFFSGLIQELYTNADNFGATFPLDLDPKMKAVVLGSIFLIDFTYFEGKH